MFAKRNASNSAQLPWPYTLAWYHPDLGLTIMEFTIIMSSFMKFYPFVSCACVYVYVREHMHVREKDLLFSKPAWDRSPLSSADLSGRKRESDSNNFLGAVSKLFSLCAKCVYWNLSFSGALATLQACKANNRILPMRFIHRIICMLVQPEEPKNYNCQRFRESYRSKISS